VEVEGATQLISPGADGVCGLNPTTGEELWRVRYAGGYSVVPRPVAGNGMVYVCTGYDAPTLLAIRLAGAQGDVTDTHVAWKQSKRVPLNPSPLLVGGELYLVSDDGIMSCLDAQSGESKWQQRLGGAYSASLTFANGKIYAQSEQGETIVVEPASEFREVSRSQIGDKTFASYAIAGQAIYLRTERALFRLQEGAGKSATDK
jgi:outer membrane protein assembly factor BamB